jgi:hypothetical protein
MGLTSQWIPAFAGMTAFTGPHEKSTSPKRHQYRQVGKPDECESSSDPPNRCCGKVRPAGMRQKKSVPQMLTGSAEGIAEARGPVPCKGTVW